MAAFLAAVESIPESRALEIDKQLDSAPVTITHNDKSYELSRDLVKFSMKTEKVTGRNFTPGVIEPSFGIGRILYVLLEQSYWVRRDDSGKNEKRAVFSFKPVIAPQKVAILPLMVKPELDPLMTRLRDECVMHGLSNRSDDSGAAIGKKYARIDELGIPFCVTCDFVGDGRVTLRERDTTKQVRVPIDEVVSVISSLCRTVAPRTWDNVLQSYPVQEAKEADN
jgi:glycyl-tRNA synthetase